MSHYKPQIITAGGMIISALAVNFLVMGMRGLLGWGAYALVSLLILLVGMFCRLLSEKTIAAISPAQPEHHSISQLIGAAFVIASAYLCYYFAQILLSCIFSDFDMFTLGTTRDYMSIPVILSLLIYAVLPALCRQAFLQLCVKESFAGAWSIIAAALFYAAVCFCDGALGWAVIGGISMWLMLRTNSLRYSMILDAMTGAVTIVLVKLNDMLAVATGESIDLSFAGGMNTTLLFGMGFILADCAILAFIFGRIKLGARKLTKIELALLITLAFAGFCVGCGLAAMGNHTHL